MSKLSCTPRAAAVVAAAAFAALPGAARAEDAAPNAGMAFVSVGAQADQRHARQAVTTLSVPVGRQAWLQAGGGMSRDAAVAGGRRVGVVTAGAGVAVDAVQLTLNTSRRAHGSAYRQTDWGASLDWRHASGHVGVDLTHRRASAAGTASASSGAAVASEASLAGTGLGVHGGLDVNERLSLYGSLARSRYRSRTRQDAAAPPGSDSLLGRALAGGASAVNRDEAALDRSAVAGATWRWSRVALSGEYSVGQRHAGQGALRSVELKSVIDVAPGWRVAPGVGRGTSDNGGHAGFASLSALYGW